MCVCVCVCVCVCTCLCAVVDVAIMCLLLCTSRSVAICVDARVAMASLGRIVFPVLGGALYHVNVLDGRAADDTYLFAVVVSILSLGVQIWAEKHVSNGRRMDETQNVC